MGAMRVACTAQPSARRPIDTNQRAPRPQQHQAQPPQHEGCIKSSSSSRRGALARVAAAAVAAAGGGSAVAPPPATAIDDFETTPSGLRYMDIK